MATLTPTENDLLTLLAAPNVPMIGKGRMKEVGALCYRLIALANEAEQAAATKEKDAFMTQLGANALWMAATGELTEEAIEMHPMLAGKVRRDLLAMRQMRLDAEQWREYCGLDLPAIPTADGR